MQKRFGTGQWSFLGPGSEKKWYSISEDSPQGEWDNMAERMMLEFAESGHPIFRQQDKLSKFCMDAGFLHVVLIGQYFMTKDTAEFSQFADSVACRSTHC